MPSQMLQSVTVVSAIPDTHVPLVFRHLGHAFYANGDGWPLVQRVAATEDVWLDPFCFHHSKPANNPGSSRFRFLMPSAVR